MASLKRTARDRSAKAQSKEDTSTDGVLELSVTVGYLAADVRKEVMGKLERLLHDHCSAGVVALERGDLEQHLHFQMVCRTKIKSARAFGSICRKYMDWSGKTMLPTGKVMCKVLTNRFIHTWKGMIGYCLKDSGTSHFDVAMHCISDEDVIAGKTLHSIYGKADLKSRVVITNKNIGEHAYVWFKYRENRQLTASLLSTLIDMVNLAMFISASSWIIPFAGLGLDHRRMNLYWKCLTDPTNVDRADVADVFIRKREYVKGHYFNDDSPPLPNAIDEYHFEGTPPTVKLEPNCGSVLNVKVEPVLAVHSLPRALHIPSLGNSPFSAVSIKNSIPARNVTVKAQKKLFNDISFSPLKRKAISFADDLGDFVPLKDIAPLPTNVFLPTSTALADDCNDTFCDAAFWESVCNKQVLSLFAGEMRGQSWKGKEKVQEDIPSSSSGKAVVEEEKDIEIIELSSDSEPKTDVVPAVATFGDRTGGFERPPFYHRVKIEGKQNVFRGEKHDQSWKGKDKLFEEIPESAPGKPEGEEKDIEIIELSSDSDCKIKVVPAVAATSKDRSGGAQPPPLCYRVKTEGEGTPGKGNNGDGGMESDIGTPTKRIRVSQIFRNTCSVQV